MTKVKDVLKVLNDNAGLEDDIAKEVMMVKPVRKRRKKQENKNNEVKNSDDNIEEDILDKNESNVESETENPVVEVKEEDIPENDTNVEEQIEDNKETEEIELVEDNKETNENENENQDEEIDEDESQNNENVSNNEDIEEVYRVLNNLDRAKMNRIEWFKAIPKKYQLQPGDIFYNYEMDRFGIFISPSYKDGLARARIFKIGSKTKLYVRDWFISYDSLILVKRKNVIRPEFIETENEFAKRAGKAIRAIDTTTLREVAISRVIPKEIKAQ